MPAPLIELNLNNMDAQEQIHHQRMGNMKGLSLDNSSQQAFPPELMRHYNLYFAFSATGKKKITKMREIKANQIGALIQVKGIVTRVSDVKPCIVVATYNCDVCGYEVY